MNLQIAHMDELATITTKAPRVMERMKDILSSVKPIRLRRSLRKKEEKEALAEKKRANSRPFKNPRPVQSLKPNRYGPLFKCIGVQTIRNEEGRVLDQVHVIRFYHESKYKTNSIWHDLEKDYTPRWIKKENERKAKELANEKG